MSKQRVSSVACSGKDCKREYHGEPGWWGHETDWVETGTEAGGTKWQPVLCPDCHEKLPLHEKANWESLRP